MQGNCRSPDPKQARSRHTVRNARERLHHIAATLALCAQLRHSISFHLRFGQHKPSGTFGRSRERDCSMVVQTRSRAGPIYTLNLVFPIGRVPKPSGKSPLGWRERLLPTILYGVNRLQKWPETPEKCDSRKCGSPAQLASIGPKSREGPPADVGS